MEQVYILVYSFVLLCIMLFIVGFDFWMFKNCSVTDPSNIFVMIRSFKNKR